MKSSPKKLEYNRARYRAKREEILAQMRTHYAENRDVIRQRQAVYRKREAAKLAVYNRSEKGRARILKYDEAHREERRLKAAQRRRENPGYAYAAVTRYYQCHPGRKTHDDSVRRARRNGATGKHTFAQWEEKKRSYEYRCAYCGEIAKLLKDHDLPLARGGSDDISNIVPACRRCNSQKRALTGVEYREQFHGPRA